jgi:hypothetical protein
LVTVNGKLHGLSHRQILCIRFHIPFVSVFRSRSSERISRHGRNRLSSNLYRAKVGALFGLGPGKPGLDPSSQTVEHDPMCAR